MAMMDSDEHDTRRMYSPEGFSEWVFDKEGLMKKETPRPHLCDVFQWGRWKWWSVIKCSGHRREGSMRQ